MRDGEALGAKVVEAVKGYIGKALGAIETRLKALEDRSPERGEKGEPGEKGDPGQDGAPAKDGVDGQDGTSVTVEDVRPLVESEIGKALLDFERRAQDVLLRSVAALPKPADGKDGRDALDLEDLGIEVAEDGRTITLSLARGDHRVERSVKLPTVIDRGVFRDGETYERNDGVTFGGSWWLAQKDAPVGKPDAGNGDWRLAVKKGRDGRDGENGKPGEKGLPGAKGDPGRDGRTLP